MFSVGGNEATDENDDATDEAKFSQFLICREISNL